MVSGFDFKRLGAFAVLLFGVLGAALIAPPYALAVGPQNGGAAVAAGSSPDPTQSWFNPNDPSCNQGCTYEKANENIQLLISYHQNRLAMAEQKTKQDLLNFLGSYCVEAERQGSSPVEDRATACMDRYRRTETVALGKMRADLLNNENSQAKLRSTVVYEAQAAVGKPGPATAAFLPSESVAKDLNAKPPGGLYFFSLRDLEKRYELDIESARAQISERFVNWTQEIRKPPAREEFAKVKKILREPGNPAAGTLSIYEMDGDGKILIDEAAYKTALQSFEGQRSVVDSDAKKYTREKAKYTDPRRIAPKLKQAARPESLKLFKNTRDGIVRYLNQDIQTKAGAKPVPAAAPDRALARTGGVAPSAAPLPTAAPNNTFKITDQAASGTGSTTADNDPEAGNLAIKPSSNNSIINLELDLKKMGDRQKKRYERIFQPLPQGPKKAAPAGSTSTPPGAAPPTAASTDSGNDTRAYPVDPPYVAETPN